VPSTPDNGALRIVRGSLVGLVALTVALAMHVLANGAVPALGPLVLALPVVSAVGIALANRRYTWRRAFAVLLLLQPIVHLLAESTAHTHDVPPTALSPSNGFTMLLAHIVAAGLAATWLAAADRIVWAWVRAVWIRPLPEVRLKWADTDTQLTSPGPSVSSTTRNVVTSAPRRGPPLSSGVFVSC
jgi:hypothetical protein